MVSESVINLLTAIGSVSVGIMSFLFTILRTRIRGPNIEIIDVESGVISSKEETSKEETTYNVFIDNKNSRIIESNKISKFLLFVQNTGDKNAFIKIDNLLFIGVSDDDNLSRFFIGSSVSSFSVKQIKTDELEVIEFNIHLPSQVSTLYSWLILPIITTWNLNGTETLLLLEPMRNFRLYGLEEKEVKRILSKNKMVVKAYKKLRNKKKIHKNHLRINPGYYFNSIKFFVKSYLKEHADDTKEDWVYNILTNDNALNKFLMRNIYLRTQ